MRRLAVPMSAISSAMSSNLLEFKVGLYASSVFFVAGAHFSAVIVYHVGLQI
jgi:hypothetical protein